MDVDVAEHLLHWWRVLEKALVGAAPFAFDELRVATGSCEGVADAAVVDARVQRALLGLVKQRLDADPAMNRRFAKATGWKILDQLLTAARLKELTRAKIVKGGRSGGLRYDVGELADTFYGRQVLDGLGFGARRRVLDKDEYEKVRAEFAKIKLALPEAIEPTTTERFFAGE